MSYVGSSSNWRLESHVIEGKQKTFLVANCRKADNVTFQPSCLPLDSFITNANGSLQISGQDFTSSSSNITLSGDGNTLSALCIGENGSADPSSLYIGNNIQNADGNLEFTGGN